MSNSISLLAPIAEAQFKHILGSRVLTVDETPIQVGPGKDGKLKQGWFWPIHGEDDEVHFLYDPSRSTRVISEVIGSEFNGVLLTDGYTVYTGNVSVCGNSVLAGVRGATAAGRTRAEAPTDGRPRLRLEATRCAHGRLRQPGRPVRHQPCRANHPASRVDELTPRLWKIHWADQPLRSDVGT